jgi:uncharacterized SAM-binding protein YcdF (DUF218 family)
MVLFHRTLELLLYPPGNLLWFLLPAVWLSIFRKGHKLKAVVWILVFGIVQVLIFSLPIVSDTLLGSLENRFPPQKRLWESKLPQAIVVLGGGRNEVAIEYGGINSGFAELERLQYAAHLHRQTGLPILVSGGDPAATGISEAGLMKRVLEQRFNTPVRWIEGNSHTTWQNAQFSDQILKNDGIQSAWVVTQAWHMPRSLFIFSRQTLEYIPASHSFGLNSANKRWFKWVPQAVALERSRIALHEYLGLLWYWLKTQGNPDN